MTLADFSQIFAVLAVQMRFTDADEVTIRAYFDVLKDIEPEFVQWAAESMARRGGSEGDQPHWFPKSSEWRAAARRIEADRSRELRARLRQLPEPACRACEDTGWAPCGQGVRRCSCDAIRRLEVLGRRPFPALPEHVEPPDLGSFERVRAMVRPLVEQATIRPLRLPEGNQ